MNIFRNRFLNTTALLLDPREPTGKDTTLNEDVGAEDDGDAGSDVGAEAGQDVGATGGDQDGDEPGGTGVDDKSGADADDDPDLADLPPEVRAKAKAAIQKRVAQETGWRDRQIDRLHAKRRSAEGDAQAAAAIVARQGTGAAAPENLTATQIEERAKELAKGISAQDQYDRDANDADARGRSIYGNKWKTTMAQLPKLGGVDVSDMVDILNTDKPHVVLFSLANPEVYERVMELPPARRRNEFVKLSMQDEPKPPRTAAPESKRPGDAPRPVVPVGGGRRVAAQQVNLYDDKADDDAWYEARNATRRKKFSDAQ